MNLFLRSSLVMCLLVGFSAAASAQQPAGARPNLLINGNFEKGTNGWTIFAHAKNGTAVIDEKEKRDGKPTLKATNSPADDLMVTQKVAVKPMTRYRLTGYIKTKDLEPEKKGDEATASFSIKAGLDRSDTVTGKSWSKITWEFDNGKSTEIEIGPRLGHYGRKVKGTAWFANLSLVELGKVKN